MADEEVNDAHIGAPTAIDPDLKLRSFEQPAEAGPAAPTVRYKVVELSTVTDEALEEVLNEWTPKGWHLDGIQFAMRETSRRPAMAFIVFSRSGRS